ncbi:ADP-ribosylation factor-like protein 6-interacting protein 1 [Diabrotica undecimpunctata]|uniref:ADP-ribosylation factor-like protein 6-interacting protein 1 n=1 Tax=Diabrotica undecimpunctata TaxID=50387 RepID=UPI003B631C57
MSETDIEIHHSPPRHFDYRGSSIMGETPHTNFIKTYEESNTLPDPIQIKIPYAPTMESQIRRLKLNIETYRELILNLNSILLWEKQWHPTALTAGCTTIFMLLWLCEPNLLTIISVIGLMITVGDYVLPSVVSTMYKQETWNTYKQKEYEEICTNIILYKTKFELLVSSYYRMRVTNPKMYFSLTIIGLSILIWIGGTISNLFLAYIFALCLLLLPGMANNGFLTKVSAVSSKIFTDLVENAKTKVGHRKVE